MTFGYFNMAFQKLGFIILIILLPLLAQSNVDEVIAEKRISVAMRTIGHHVLLCHGDESSRVMPIEKVDNSYKIPFEFDFGFNPEDIMFIVDDVKRKTGFAEFLLVEIENCETKDIVHSFELGNTAYEGIMGCVGRGLPESCYNLLITILDGTEAAKKLDYDDENHPINIDPPVLDAAEVAATNSDPSRMAYWSVPLLVFIGFIGYVITKREPEKYDPFVVPLGASRFDKRNMTLSHKGITTELSNKEAELLALLHDSANQPIEREVILQKVWGDEGDYVGRTLDVFISKLRKKLEADTTVKIVNIRGIGYKLVVNETS
ncbi:MAG: winged helix-turn-helix domain-containing protein [Bacteroidota bacterium]